MAHKVQKMYHKTWQKKDFLKMFQFSEKIGPGSWWGGRGSKIYGHNGQSW